MLRSTKYYGVYKVNDVERLLRGTLAKLFADPAGDMLCATGAHRTARALAALLALLLLLAGGQGIASDDTKTFQWDHRNNATDPTWEYENGKYCDEGHSAGALAMQTPVGDACNGSQALKGFALDKVNKSGASCAQLSYAYSCGSFYVSEVMTSSVLSNTTAAESVDSLVRTQELLMRCNARCSIASGAVPRRGRVCVPHAHPVAMPPHCRTSSR